MNLRYKIKEWMDAFDHRSMPEKMLFSLLGLALPVWLYSVLYLSPASAQIDGLEQQLTSVRAQLQSMQQREQLALTSSAQDPNQAVRLRIERAIQDQTELQGEIQQLAGNLVTPQSMTRLLTSMLENQSGLTLVKVENRFPQPMRSDGQGATDSTETVSQAQESSSASRLSEHGQQVYKHSLVIELEGDYLSLIGYLRRIEGFSERFFWDSISFVQQTWPIGRITLELHTLSTEEGFVGV